MVSNFVEAYWEYQRLSSGDRRDRLAARDLFWVYDHIQRLIESDPQAALRLVVELAESAPSDFGVVLIGTGPLEDLLRQATSDLLHSVQEAGRRSARLRAALESSTLTDTAAAALRPRD